jgi:hypothetical protein
MASAVSVGRRIALAAVVVVGAVLQGRVALAQNPIFIDCGAAVLESWTPGKSLDGDAGFRLRASCFLTEWRPEGSRDLGRDPDTHVDATYHAGQGEAEHTLRLNLDDKQHVFSITLSGCPRNPFIRWRSGPVTCAGPPRVSAWPDRDLVGRMFFFGGFQQREVPVGAGVLDEIQARQRFARAPLNVFRIVRVIPTDVTVPQGQRGALPPSFEMKFVHTGMAPTTIGFATSDDPTPRTPISATPGTFGAQRYVSVVLPSSAITSGTKTIKFDMQSELAGAVSSTSYVAEIVEMPGGRFADPAFNRGDKGREVRAGQRAVAPQPRATPPSPQPGAPVQSAAPALPAPAPGPVAGGAAQRRALKMSIKRIEPGYRSLGADNAQQCQAACTREARCKAWTWVKPGVDGSSAKCWLRDPAPAPGKDECCTSGVK